MTFQNSDQSFHSFCIGLHPRKCIWWKEKQLWKCSACFLEKFHPSEQNGPASGEYVHLMASIVVDAELI